MKHPLHGFKKFRRSSLKIRQGRLYYPDPLNKDDLQKIIDYENMINDLSVSTIQQAAIDYLNTNNYVKVVLYPENID